MKNKVLEVIVSSLADAKEAAAGGADRLEVVRDLSAGGLTPSIELVSEIAVSVSIPIRVMVRENSSMQVADERELHRLCSQAAGFSRLPVDGLVLGFVLAGNVIDVHSLNVILGSAPGLRATFHRAFDCLSDPLASIVTLKTIPQVDRILTIGGTGSWLARRARLHRWQQHAQPQIRILAGTGILPSVIEDLAADATIQEIHVGRAARNPCETSGSVSRLQVARLKGLCA
jgi:copper homeostasis protein